jgi:hypothetical protein
VVCHITKKHTKREFQNRMRREHMNTREEKEQEAEKKCKINSVTTVDFN